MLVIGSSLQGLPILGYIALILGPPVVTGWVAWSVVAFPRMCIVNMRNKRGDDGKVYGWTRWDYIGSFAMFIGAWVFVLLVQAGLVIGALLAWHVDALSLTIVAYYGIPAGIGVMYSLRSKQAFAASL